MDHKYCLTCKKKLKQNVRGRKRIYCPRPAICREVAYWQRRFGVAR